MLDNKELERLVGEVLAELRDSGAVTPTKKEGGFATLPPKEGELHIDLPDPSEAEYRYHIGVKDPADPDGLKNLRAATNARIGIGRAGPRPRTASALLFQGDHGVTQDAIYGVVSQEIRDEMGLFTVATQVGDREEYLLRPDLGRRLSDEARKEIEEKCIKNPDVQICIGDGLSAAAIDNNLREIYPVLAQGLKDAGLTVGTPFFIENARVGIMNDVNTIVKAKVLVILIGERPGLGIADAMSAYLGYDPQPGKTDADRDLLCMITTHGGTNPLEAGAYVVELIKRMIKYSASGVDLRRAMGEEE